MRKFFFGMSAFLAAVAIAACVGDDPTTTTDSSDASTSEASSGGDSATPDSAAGSDSGVNDAGGFTPADVPHVALWLNGSSVTAASGKVTAWNDLSSNGNNGTPSSPATQPSAIGASSGINGHPVVRFDGATTGVTFPDTASLEIGPDAFLLEVVAQLRSGDAGAFPQVLYTKHAVGSQDGLSVFVFPGASDTITGAITNDGNYVVGLPTASLETPHRISIAWTPDADGGPGGTLSGDIDGNIATPTHTPSTPDMHAIGESLIIGATSTTYSQWFAGDIAELVLVHGAISDSDRTKLEAYLNQRYGL